MGTGDVTINTPLFQSGAIPGDSIKVTGAAGTGSFALINGTWLLKTGSTSQKYIFNIGMTGLTMTITGATVTNGMSGVKAGDNVILFNVCSHATCAGQNTPVTQVNKIWTAAARQANTLTLELDLPAGLDSASGPGGVYGAGWLVGGKTQAMVPGVIITDLAQGAADMAACGGCTNSPAVLADIAQYQADWRGNDPSVTCLSPPPNPQSNQLQSKCTNLTIDMFALSMSMFPPSPSPREVVLYEGNPQIFAQFYSATGCAPASNACRVLTGGPEFAAVVYRDPGTGPVVTDIYYHMKATPNEAMPSMLQHICGGYIIGTTIPGYNWSFACPDAFNGTMVEGTMTPAWQDVITYNKQHP
jgi:hypothetical protein